MLHQNVGSELYNCELLLLLYKCPFIALDTINITEYSESINVHTQRQVAIRIMFIIHSQILLDNVSVCTLITTMLQCLKHCDHYC